MPFTAIIALSYALKTKYAIYKEHNENIIRDLLFLCYRWLKITVITFLALFPLLVLFFVLLQRYS